MGGGGGTEETVGRTDLAADLVIQSDGGQKRQRCDKHAGICMGQQTDQGSDKHGKPAHVLE
jgi:hypothetical protein